MHKYFFISIIYFLTTVPQITSLGQSKLETDSLIRMLNSRLGNEKMILEQIVYASVDVDNTLALKYASKYYDVCRASGDSAEIVKSGRIYGQMLRRNEKFDSSTIVFDYVVPIARRHGFEKDLRYSLNSLSIIYSHEALYDKSLANIFQCLQIPSSLVDSVFLSGLYYNLGFVYYKLGDWDKSLDYSMKSLAIKERHRDEYLLQNLKINIALSLIMLNDLMRAKHWLSTVQYKGDRKNVLMEWLFANGELCQKSNDLANAELKFSDALKIAREEKDHRFQFDCLEKLTALSIASKRFSLAREYFVETERLSVNTHFNREIMRFYRQYSEFFLAENDYKNASRYQSKLINLSDSINTREARINLLRVEGEFRQAENLAKIDIQKQLLISKDEAIKWQSFFIVSSSIVIVLISALSVLLYLRSRDNQRMNLKLDELVRRRTNEMNQLLHDAQMNLNVSEGAYAKLVSRINQRIANAQALSTLYFNQPHDLELRREIENILISMRIDSSNSTGEISR